MREPVPRRNEIEIQTEIKNSSIKSILKNENPTPIAQRDVKNLNKLIDKLDEYKKQTR